MVAWKCTAGRFAIGAAARTVGGGSVIEFLVLIPSIACAAAGFLLCLLLYGLPGEHDAAHCTYEYPESECLDPSGAPDEDDLTLRDSDLPPQSTLERVHPYLQEGGTFSASGIG